MPRTIYRYTPSGLREDPCSIIDAYDQAEGGDTVDLAEADVKQENCKPSADILENMQQTPEDDYPPFLTLARAHFTGLGLSEHGFPGHERTDAILKRALLRATQIIPDNGCATSARAQEAIILAFEDCYRRLKLVAEEAILEHYGLRTHPGALTALAALFDDNFIYKEWDRNGMARADPFRHPAIAQVFAKAFLAESCSDMYGFKIYFYPRVPAATILLVCTAIRAALDEHAKNVYTPRDFSRDQYGPILADLTSRWSLLSDAYATETQVQLSRTIKLAMRQRSSNIPGMLPSGPNASLPTLAQLYEWRGVV